MSKLRSVSLCQPNIYYKYFNQLYYAFPLYIDKVNRNSEEHNVYHYITEAAKFAASYRMKLGDPDKNSAADVVRLNSIVPLILSIL